MLYSHNHNDINNNSTYTYVKTQADSLLFRFEPFINFWLLDFDTRRETILKSLSLSYYAKNTLMLVKSRGPISISNTMVGPQLLNIIFGPNFSPS